jgi:hypothetical protein
MHLHHPSLSLNGKKKGKIKFRNAEEAHRARELEDSWKDLQKKFKDPASKERFDDYIPPFKNLGALYIKAYKLQMKKQSNTVN